jgi:hypothetical protein
MHETDTARQRFKLTKNNASNRQPSRLGRYSEHADPRPDLLWGQLSLISDEFFAQGITETAWSR